MSLYRGATCREIVQRSSGFWNAVQGLVVYPFVPWTLGRRPDWIPRNVGDWVKEARCQSK